eukprot:CAMPEP_0175758124 /NCGR_PEP_ID=MMETSP0097-20121207/64840_1 /TAXON_ID=311494 /ORGANISM="Alexandrium monilatum, Strain CCMP3105" /LENGTH=131 /DNA_ID=CAMNT_0017067373 /DNA_START=3 /DNA_END=395 /DNA_ORIENTATION=-
MTNPAHEAKSSWRTARGEAPPTPRITRLGEGAARTLKNEEGSGRKHCIPAPRCAIEEGSPGLARGIDHRLETCPATKKEEPPRARRVITRATSRRASAGRAGPARGRGRRGVGGLRGGQQVRSSASGPPPR